MFWDLDHRDGGGPCEYLGVSHRSCNRGERTRAANGQYAEPFTPTKLERGITSRDW